MTTIFDSVTRTDGSYKKRAESIFAHLNRSAKHSVEVSRDLVEGMFSHVPCDSQVELRARFRSGSDAELASAFQELCLHELLIKQGCKLASHPCVTGTSKRPDFRVIEAKGLRFLLEARASTEVSTGPVGDPRGNQIRDFLDGFSVGEFLLGIDEIVAGSKDLRCRTLARHILESLNPASVQATCVFSIPKFETEDGWKIRLKAIPAVSCEKGNGRVRYEAWGRDWRRPSTTLLAALSEKARRYGNQLGMPFVIAINSFDATLGERDFAGAVLGEKGLWGSSNNPRCRRVSAVLFTANLWPATLLMGQVNARLYLNPFAEWHYDGVLLNLNTCRFQDGSWCCQEGNSISQLLDLGLHKSSLWD